MKRFSTLLQSLRLLPILMAVACTPSFDKPAGPEFQPDHGLRFGGGSRAYDGNFIGVTFSGGGVRASALAFGTLLTLNEIDPDGSRLINSMDILASVSGGSVTAGWYAVHGPDGLKDEGRVREFVEKFLKTDHMGPIAWRALNPLTLARYAVTPYRRIDALSDYFAEEMFGSLTMGEIARRYRSDPRRPLPVLNAADMSTGQPFRFIQGYFDLICADLDSYRLSDAVAVSAAFPIVFSPRTLRNYSGDGCPMQQSAAWAEYGPPKWLNARATSERDSLNEPPGQELESAPPIAYPAIREAHQRMRLLAGGEKAFVHLLDGGIADNLGVTALMQIEDKPAIMPGLRKRLAEGLPPFDKVTRALFVIVNAKTERIKAWDSDSSPPGLLSTLRAVTDAPLDSAIIAIQSYLTAEIGAVSCGVDPKMVQMGSGQPATDDNCRSDLQGYIATVDFDLIPDSMCRRWFKELATTWSLDPPVIDALMAVSKVLLLRSPGLRSYLTDVGVWPPEMPSWDAACRLAWASAAPR